MTIRECYSLMNGDFDGVLSRLLSETRIAKFVVRFPDDPSYQLLLDSLESHDIPTAFRAAHTLKGTAANLGFSDLYTTSSAVCEDLRDGNPSENLMSMVEDCKIEYAKVMTVLRNYIANKED